MPFRLLSTNYRLFSVGVFQNFTNKLSRRFTFQVRLLIRPSHRLIRNQEDRGVVRIAKANQVRSRRQRSHPNERHAHVIIAQGSIQDVVVVFTRRFTGRLLHAPNFSLRVTRRMQVNSVQLIYRVMMPFIRSRLRLVSGLLLATRRFNGTFSIVKSVRHMIPNISFVRAKTQLRILPLFQVREKVRHTIKRSKAGHARLLTVMVLVPRDPLARRLNIFLLSRHVYRRQRVPINGVVFRNVQGQVVVLFTRKSMTFTRVIIVIQTRRIRLSKDDDALTRPFMNDLSVMVTRATRVDVRSVESEQVTFRHRYLTSMRFPLQRPSTFLMRISRNTSSIRLFFKVRRYRRYTSVTMNIPRQGSHVTISNDVTSFRTFRRQVFTVRILGSIQVSRRIMRNNVRGHLVVIHPTFRRRAQRVIIPRLTSDHARFIRVRVQLFNIRVRTNVFSTSGQSARLCFSRFIFFNVVLRPSASIIATRLAIMLHMRFVFTKVNVPFNFRSLRLTLFLPMTNLLKNFTRLRRRVSQRGDLQIVTRHARRLTSLCLHVTRRAGNHANFVHRPLARVRRSVPLPFQRDGAYRTNARKNNDFHLSIVFHRSVAVVT